MSRRRRNASDFSYLSCQHGFWLFLWPAWPLGVVSLSAWFLAVSDRQHGFWLFLWPAWPLPGGCALSNSALVPRTGSESSNTTVRCRPLPQPTVGFAQGAVERSGPEAPRGEARPIPLEQPSEHGTCHCRRRRWKNLACFERSSRGAQRALRRRCRHRSASTMPVDTRRLRNMFVSLPPSKQNSPVA